MRKLLAVAAVAVALAACGQPQSAPSAEPQAAPAPAAAPKTTRRCRPRSRHCPRPTTQASYEAGRRVFAQCRSCHTIEAGEPNRVGPNLHGVFGREIGTAAGFNYSQRCRTRASSGTPRISTIGWPNPQTFLPGNRMAFAGVRDETQRRDVIAYLMVESAAPNELITPPDAPRPRRARTSSICARRRFRRFREARQQIVEHRHHEQRQHRRERKAEEDDNADGHAAFRARAVAEGSAAPRRRWSRSRSSGSGARAGPRPR